MKRTERGIAVGCLPPPPVFGAPAKFSKWREVQEEGLVLLDGSTKATSILQLPTGAGKSLLAVMHALMNGLRALILVETRALEDVYAEDFRSCGLVDIRGANNYRCPALEKGGRYQHLRLQQSATADNGPCRQGLECELKNGGCPWFDRQREVTDAPIVSTNYANWLSAAKQLHRGGGKESSKWWGQFDVIILDEVHAAGDQVTRALTVELDLVELRGYFGEQDLGRLPNQVRRATGRLLGSGDTGNPDTLAGWSSWLGNLRKRTGQALEGATDELQHIRNGGGKLYGELLHDIRYLRRLATELSTLAAAEADSPGDWVAEIDGFRRRQVVSFTPVWPTAYCKSFLFRGIPKVIGMSATVHPYMVEKLGFEEGEYDFWEFDSDFPVENRPIYYFPVAFMRFDMPETEKLRWVHANDQIAKTYRGEKGIIHTGSYERAKYFEQNSTLGRRVKTHTSDTTGRVVREFKDSTGDDVLVSPSVGTGWSFDDDAARWQSIIKVQWRDKRSKLMKRRCDEDKKYQHVLAMDDIVQKAGRIVRSMTDWGKTFITDKMFGDWYERNSKQYAAMWFRRAVKTVTRVPR